MKSPKWDIRDLEEHDPEAEELANDLERRGNDLLQKWAENYSASGGKGPTMAPE